VQTFKPSTPSGVWAKFDFAATTDYTYAGTTKFDIDFVTSMVGNPFGNHVNKLRGPELSPNLYSMWIERTSYAGDSDPTVYFYADDFYTKPLVTYPQPPAARDASIGYKSVEYHCNKVLHRTSMRCEKYGSADGFEVQNLIWVFAPDSGK
jgi:hypothetical protein